MPKAPVAPPASSPSTVEVTSIEAIGDDKVAITLKMEVDVHRTVEVGGELMSVAIKEVNSHTPQSTNDQSSKDQSSKDQTSKDPQTLRTG